PLALLVALRVPTPRPRVPAAPPPGGPATGRLSDSARESRQEDPMRNDHRYVLGESENEHSRLRDQSVVLDPLTRSLLIDAGITEGMRVLDIGTGSGAVAALAADLVGSHGHVLASIATPPPSTGHEPCWPGTRRSKSPRRTSPDSTWTGNSTRSSAEPFSCTCPNPSRLWSASRSICARTVCW